MNYKTSKRNSATPKLAPGSLVFVFLLMLTTNAHSETLKLVEAQGSQSPGYEESTKLHIAVIKEVFKKHFSEFSLVREPFIRALHSTRNQQYDILLVTLSSDYAPRSGLITSHNPIDVARVVALTLKDKNILWPDVVKIRANYKIGWINGYAYDSLLGLAPDLQLPKSDLGLKMVLQNRLDVFIDDDLGVQVPLNGELSNLRGQFDIQEIHTIALHPSFANTVKGNTLRALFDKEFSSVETQVSLAALYRLHTRQFPIKVSRLKSK